MSFNDIPSPRTRTTNELDAVDGYDTWDSTQLNEFFERKGLCGYEEILTQHCITGNIAPMLTDTDLRDMGIGVVGDRCRFRHGLDALKRKSRADNRTEVVWEGKERLFYGCLDASMATFFGFCRENASTYKLTSSHLRVKQVIRPIILSYTMMCSCCSTDATNNIDLSNVDDVDMVTTRAPFMLQLMTCFMTTSGMDVVDVSTRNEGKIQLVLRKGLGEKMTQLIMNQCEEAQSMER